MKREKWGLNIRGVNSGIVEERSGGWPEVPGSNPRCFRSPGMVRHAMWEAHKNGACSSQCRTPVGARNLLALPTVSFGQPRIHGTCGIDFAAVKTLELTSPILYPTTVVSPLIYVQVTDSAGLEMLNLHTWEGFFLETSVSFTFQTFCLPGGCQLIMPGTPAGFIRCGKQPGL
jgi:hypothetical protein